MGRMTTNQGVEVQVGDTIVGIDEIVIDIGIGSVKGTVLANVIENVKEIEIEAVVTERDRRQADAEEKARHPVGTVYPNETLACFEAESERRRGAREASDMKE